MEVFGMAAFFGFLLGFMFGVGCAAAVIYTVYMGGYRKAIQDSLQETKTERYSSMFRKVTQKLAAAPADFSKR
jgi:hypothetical protein